jgi:DNA polymerase
MLKAEEIITLDFETYFDKDYSLTKLATSEYVRDERFKAQCVGIKIGTDNVVWIPDRNVEEALRSIDWKSYALLAHHTQFDGFILTERYGITPAYYLCTLSMGRGLHSIGVGASLDALAQFYDIGNKIPDVLRETKGVRDWPPELMEKAGLYCAVDTQLCHDLFLKMFDKFEYSELDLIDETCRMFCEPVLQISRPTALRALELEKDNKHQKIKKAQTDPANLSSNLKFADLLRSFGVEPPMKISPTTGKPTFAFAKNDAGFQELMVHDDEAVRAIVEARIAVKSTIGETRAERLLKEGDCGRPIPVYLKYYGAHTGRWSGGNKMNLQNLPRIDKNDPDSGLLRKSIIAPEGYVIVVADLAQIEARMLAWLAKDADLLQQFRDNLDAYKIMASSIYHKDVEDITAVERFVGKTAILGLGYQMGWRRFLMTITLGLMGPKMPMEPETAQLVVTTYRLARVAITNFWDVCEDMLQHMLYDMDMEVGPLRIAGEEKRIYMPNNMYLEYPGLSQSNDGFVYFDYENADILARGGCPNPKRGRKIYGGLLAENITQALSRVVLGPQLLEVAKRYKIASTTHDELIAIAPEAEADAALEFMVETMRTPPIWAPDIPLDAEGGWAREYSK